MRYKITYGREWYNLRRKSGIIVTRIGKNIDKFDKNIAGIWVSKLKSNAPKSSGFLSRSIHLRKIASGKDINTVFISVDAPHAIYQEQGVNRHFVGANAISPAGYTFGEWMRAHGIMGRGMWVGGPNSRMGNQNAFFSRTAFEMDSVINKEITKLNKKIEKRLKKK